MHPHPPFKPRDAPPTSVSSTPPEAPPTLRREPFPLELDTFREVILALRAQARAEQHGAWSLRGIAQFFRASPAELLPCVHELVNEGTLEWREHPRSALEWRALNFLAKLWFEDVRSLFPARKDKFDAYDYIVNSMMEQVVTNELAQSFGYREQDCPPEWAWFIFSHTNAPRTTRLQYAQHLPIIEPRDIERILEQLAHDEPARWAGVTAHDLGEILNLDEQLVPYLETMLEWMIDKKEWEIEVSHDLSQRRYRTRGARTANQSGPAGVYELMRHRAPNAEWSPSEIAKSLDIKTETALYYLNNLISAELVEKHGRGAYQRTRNDPYRAILEVLATRKPPGRMKAADLTEAILKLSAWPNLKKVGPTALYAFIDELEGVYVTIGRVESSRGASTSPKDIITLLPRTWWDLQRCPKCSNAWRDERLELDASANKGVEARWEPPRHVHCPDLEPQPTCFDPLPDTHRSRSLAQSTTCRTCSQLLRDGQDASPVTIWDLEAAGRWPPRHHRQAEERAVRRLIELASAARWIASAKQAKESQNVLSAAFEKRAPPGERARAFITIGERLERADLTDEAQAREWVCLIRDAATLLNENRAKILLGSFQSDEPSTSAEDASERAMELVEQARALRDERLERIQVVHRDGALHHPKCAEGRQTPR